MAANHIAMVRSSARAAFMRSHEMAHEKNDSNMNSRKESGDNPDVGNNNDTQQSLADELSQMSVISIASLASDHRVDDTSERKGSLVPEPMVAKLARLDTVADIDECVDAEFSQDNTVQGLERNWQAISNQLQAVVEHLNRGNQEVSLASQNCLQSLVESVELTCDKVDGEMKALYQLMSKCDELMTKLSMAGSFSDEIKTLRKSVETLEALYKHRPKFPRDMSRIMRYPTGGADTTEGSTSVRSSRN